MLRNCERCKKGMKETDKEYKCDIQLAIDTAWFGDGEVSEEIWKRMGGPENEGYLTWDCPEMEVERS